MRTQLLKTKSTKAERRFAERLKDAHILFKAKVMIKNREVDFIVGKYAIDIDGHKQDVFKNIMLVKEGYIPLHINNNEVTTIPIKQLWQQQIIHSV